MTYEEAIKYIEDVLNSDYHYDESLGYQLSSDDFGWLETAKEALEKQIPQKPQHNERSFDVYICKICGGLVGIPKVYKQAYCWKCGQAVDWSDLK